MICETCKAEGRTSRVHDRGGGFTTLMNVQSFSDEQGKAHLHDPNTTTVEYGCSNGHRWAVKSTPSCWCGWPNKREPEAASAVRERLGFKKPSSEASDNTLADNIARPLSAERDAAREEVARLRKALDAVMDACDPECYGCGAYYVAKEALGLTGKGEP